MWTCAHQVLLPIHQNYQVNNCPLQDLIQLSPNVIQKYIIKKPGYYHNIAFDPEMQFTLHYSKDHWDIFTWICVYVNIDGVLLYFSQLPVGYYLTWLAELQSNIPSNYIWWSTCRIMFGWTNGFWRHTDNIAAENSGSGTLEARRG